MSRKPSPLTLSRRRLLPLTGNGKYTPSLCPIIHSPTLPLAKKGSWHFSLSNIMSSPKKSIINMNSSPESSRTSIQSSFHPKARPNFLKRFNIIQVKSWSHNERFETKEATPEIEGPDSKDISEPDSSFEDFFLSPRYN